MVVLVLFSFSVITAENYLYPVKAKKSQSPVYTKTTPAAYLDWTQDNTQYYLSSGAAADTFAVYMEPTGTGIMLNTIEMSWYNGDGANNVLLYVWEVGPDCPESGLSTDLVGTEAHVIGNVLAGPIPFAPAAGYVWQGIELSDFSGDLAIGSEDNPVPFFIGFVKLGELPYPLAANTTVYLGVEENHTFIKGPNFTTANDYWSDYNSYIELSMRAGITYVGNAAPVIASMNQLPNTYDGAQDFSIEAMVTDDEALPAESVVLKYNVNAGDEYSLTMTDDGGDMYSATLTGLELAVGDVLTYWVEATDAGEKIGVGPDYDMTVIEPANPDATVLLVDDGMAIDASGPIQAFLESLGLQVEAYNVADNNGWDASITTYEGTDESVYDVMIVMGFGTTTVPTRAYDESHPVAAYLTAGGNLLYCDQDYFYTNDEAPSPVFAQGDFAYDFFSIAGGENDPAENAFLSGYGDDFLASITNATFDYSVFGNTNWPDYVTEEDATPIFLVADAGSYADLTIGTFYAGDGFNTILFSAPILGMNEGTYDAVILSTQFERLLWHCLYDGFGFEIPNYIEGETGAIRGFALNQNYPNPFNPVTTISYTIPQASDVSITIYNAMGQEVKTLINEYKLADTYNITWDATNNAGNKVASGIYYYRLKAGDVSQVHKMILLK
jgi:hypothetical protein